MDRLLTTGEAATIRGLHRERILHLVQEGRIPAVRVGPHWIIRESDLMAWNPLPPGRPRIRPMPDPSLPKRPRGRPRKRPVDVPNPAAPSEAAPRASKQPSRASPKAKDNI